MSETAEEFAFKRLFCGYVPYKNEDEIMAQFRSLNARVAKLEEALREILRWDSGDEPISHLQATIDCCPSCIARAALAGKVKLL